MSRAARLALLAMVALGPATAFAHKVNVFADVEEGQIVGKVYFRGGSPAQHVTVTALDPAGRELGKATTDAEGRFRLAARCRCDTKLVADTGDGHGADYLIEAKDLPEDLPAGVPATDATAAPKAAPAERDVTAIVLPDTHPSKGLEREIAAFREDLDAFRQETRIRDVLGGIGYILGLSGVAFYLLGRRDKKANDRR